MQEVKKDATISETGSVTPSEEKTVEPGPLVYESKAVNLIVLPFFSLGCMFWKFLLLLFSCLSIWALLPWVIAYVACYDILLHIVFNSWLLNSGGKECIQNSSGVCKYWVWLDVGSGLLLALFCACRIIEEDHLIWIVFVRQWEQ